MLILWYLRSAFEITSYDYSEVEGNTEEYITKRSIANVDITDPYINITNTSITWNGLNFFPHYHICSANNRLKEKRPKIATIGVPDEIKETQKELELTQKENALLEKDIEELGDYDSVEELKASWERLKDKVDKAAAGTFY